MAIAATAATGTTADGLIASPEPGWPQWRGPRRDGISDERGLLSTEPVTVGPDMDILKVCQLFLDNKCRRLPVLKEGWLVGQISRRDVLRAIREIRKSGL